MTAYKEFILANKKTGMVAIAMASALVISSTGSVSAMTVADSTKMSNQSQAMSGHSSQAAEDLRVTMNNLLREHVTVGLTATRSIVDGAPQSQINAAESAQLLNADALAQAVGSVYGGEAQASFSTLFKEHIEQSNRYAVAVANGDQNAKAMALTELQDYLHDIAAFFSGAIPGLQEQDAYGLLNEHEELVNKSIEAYKAGDFVQSYQMEREALKQISRAADMISAGIIATQPTKF